MRRLKKCLINIIYSDEKLVCFKEEKMFEWFEEVSDTLLG